MSGTILASLRRHLSERRAGYERNLYHHKFNDLGEVRANQLAMLEIDYLLDVVKEQERRFVEDGD